MKQHKITWLNIPGYIPRKVQFKAGIYHDCFEILPSIQIVYNGNGWTGFSIELGWGKWGIGWRFYEKD